MTLADLEGVCPTVRPDAREATMLPESEAAAVYRAPRHRSPAQLQAILEHGTLLKRLPTFVDGREPQRRRITEARSAS